MKILHILDERWDSALTAYGLSLAEAQKKSGRDVYVAAKPGRFAFQSAQAKSIPVLPLSNPLALRAWAGRTGIDVLNAHTGSGHTWGWIASLGRPVALVRTRGEARDIRRNPFHAPIYGRTDTVIAASQALAHQYLVAFPFLESKLHVVYPGLDVADFSPEADGPVRIALVGRLDPVKGQKIFLAAVDSIKAKLSDEEFHISGEEKNTRLEDLKAFAAEHGLDRWVRFSGRQADAAAFMRSCHAGVVASIGSEALSRVTLEWMAVGRPVVASTVGCLPELISSGDNGFLVPPNNPNVLGQILLKLVKDGNFRRQIGGRAHEIARERFGRERFVRETQDIYQEALRARRSS